MRGPLRRATTASQGRTLLAAEMLPADCWACHPRSSQWQPRSLSGGRALTYEMAPQAALSHASPIPTARRAKMTPGRLPALSQRRLVPASAIRRAGSRLSGGTLSVRPPDALGQRASFECGIVGPGRPRRAQDSLAPPALGRSAARHAAGCPALPCSPSAAPGRLLPLLCSLPRGRFARTYVDARRLPNVIQPSLSVTPGRLEAACSSTATKSRPRPRTRLSGHPGGLADEKARLLKRHLPAVPVPSRSRRARGH